MEISISKNDERIDVSNITIYVENREFRISLNKFKELIINKEAYGSEEGSLVIRPRVSNEISLK